LIWGDGACSLIWGGGACSGCVPWFSCVGRTFLWPLIPARCLGPARSYDVDVPAMLFQLHEWDIHALCFGTGGAKVTEVCSRVRVLP
jgi:hypothetical protein